MSKQDIVIVSALRTGIGNFNGTLGNMPAHKLGQTVIKAVLDQCKVKGEDVSEVIMGQILSCGEGQNPARQASIGAGIPKEVPAWIVNQVCGSGLRSVALGYQAIKAGQSNIVIAGGQESMSMCPHGMNMRNGQKMGNAEFTDLMIKDGLTDAFSTTHMGITAENIAEKYGITREEQDQFSAASQNKAEAAQKAGKFNDEIVPVASVTCDLGFMYFDLVYE